MCVSKIQQDNHKITFLIMKNNFRLASPRNRSEEKYFVFPNGSDDRSVLRSFLSEDLLGVDETGRFIIDPEVFGQVRPLFWFVIVFCLLGTDKVHSVFN